MRLGRMKDNSLHQRNPSSEELRMCTHLLPADDKLSQYDVFKHQLETTIGNQNEVLQCILDQSSYKTQDLLQGVKQVGHAQNFLISQHKTRNVSCFVYEQYRML